MMAFAQQVGEREPEVKGRVAKMDDLMVQQDQPVVMDQNILRAVIAVHEGVNIRARFPDEVQQEGPG